MNRQTVLFGLIVSLLVSGCASTRMKSVQHLPDFNSKKINRALVVSIASTPEIRRQLEGEFVRQWKKYGVTADASSTVLPTGMALYKAGVAPFAKAQGYDSVLVTRVMKRQKIRTDLPQPAFGPLDETDLTDYLNAVVASPEYGMQYEIVTIRTNIYDVASERLLWSGTSGTLIAEDIPKLIGPFVKVILRNVYAK